MKNNKLVTRISALALASMFLFSGCGINGAKTFATLNDQKISMGFANFVARYQQATYDQLYVDFVGPDYWSQDLYGSGNNMETDIKAELADAIKEMYVLDAHKDEYGVSVTADEQKKIDEATAKFFEINDKKAIKEIGAKEEYVKEYLRLGLVSNKLSKAIKDGINPDYTMEDAAQKAVSYVAVSKNGAYDDNGNPVEYTDEERENVKAAMEELSKVNPEEFEAKAEENDYTVMPATFGEDDNVTPAVVKEAVASLEVGKVSGLLEDDDRYYVVRYDSEYDEEATKTHLDDFIITAKDEGYTKQLEEWENASAWELNAEEWEKVKFDVLFTSPAQENEEG